MARTLATVYRIDRRSWLPEHNSPVVWFEVSAGHDARDYQAENYRAGFKTLGKFRSEAEAQAYYQTYAATMNTGKINGIRAR